MKMENLINIMNIIKLIAINIVFLSYSTISLNFDSLLNRYNDKEYKANEYKDIANSTWKEIIVSDRLVNLVKCQPAFIDNDSELDIFVLDSETKLYWVSNVRGTSGTFSHQFVSHSKLLDFVVQGDGRNSKDFFLLGINSAGKKILKYTSKMYDTNNTISWSESTFFDLNDEMVLMIIKDYLITGINLYPVSESKQVRII